MGGDGNLAPLPVSADAAARSAQYAAVAERVDALLEGETEWVAAQATVACELHHAFECASACGIKHADASATAHPRLYPTTLEEKAVVTHSAPRFSVSNIIICV
jgi:hypothetical protein